MKMKEPDLLSAVGKTCFSNCVDKMHITYDQGDITFRGFPLMNVQLM
jgi:hypothetical protein